MEEGREEVASRGGLLTDIHQRQHMQTVKCRVQGAERGAGGYETPSALYYREHVCPTCPAHLFQRIYLEKAPKQMQRPQKVAYTDAVHAQASTLGPVRLTRGFPTLPSSPQARIIATAECGKFIGCRMYSQRCKMLAHWWPALSVTCFVLLALPTCPLVSPDNPQMPCCEGTATLS